MRRGQNGSILLVREMSQNLIEKIVHRFTIGLEPEQRVHSGDFVTVKPRHVMTHDNTSAVMLKFKGLGAQRVAEAQQPIFTLDHNVQDQSPDNLEKYRNIQAFAIEQGVRFFPAGRGIGHQIMLEEGFAWPGTLVVASDSHSNIYGGLGALGTPVVRTDAAAIWATGETWWQVPPVTRVEMHGALRPGVDGKDVIVALCGLYNQDEVLNHALEFCGPGVSGLSIDARFTISNMTTEWGALAGVFPCDEVTLEWLRARIGKGSRIDSQAVAELEAAPVHADADANYAQVIRLDLTAVVPCICGPDTVKVMEPVSAVEPRRVKVDKAYLLSCVNGRSGDLAAAAAVLQGRKVADGVGFYVAPASDQVRAECEANGVWEVLVQAGAQTLPAGCGPCIGMGVGLLEDGEVGISATNRNFKGRMGSRDAQAFLASPAVVAASAAVGYICAPQECAGDGPARDRQVPDPVPAAKLRVPILDGFPARVEGQVLWCDADNLNTDGIYPGKYTYREDMSPQQMAQVAMENYDTGFQEQAQDGDLLASGFNFGTGSSREQAATALAYRGLRLVIAGSFSATYKRNAFNNGYLLVECPGLIEHLRAASLPAAPTVRSGVTAVVDFAKATIEYGGKEFSFPPLGPTAQKLIVAEGLENMVRQSLG